MQQRGLLLSEGNGKGGQGTEAGDGGRHGHRVLPEY